MWGQVQGKTSRNQKKKKYNGQQQKEMDCHEPHPAPNEKMQPIQWTERPTGALVGANSLWPHLASPNRTVLGHRGGKVEQNSFRAQGLKSR